MGYRFLKISQDFSRFLKLSPVVEIETETEMTAQFMATLSIYFASITNCAFVIFLRNIVEMAQFRAK